MKRIVFTVTNEPNYDQRMHKICGSLQQAGYQVLLVGRKKSNSKPLVPKIFEQKRLSLFFEKGKLFYLEYNLRLFLFLLIVKTDVICAIDLDSIMPCLLAGGLRGKKKVYDAHEYFTEVPEVMHRPAIQKVWQWVEKTAVPHMDACYTVGASLAWLYQEKYGISFAVIKNVPYLRPLPEKITDADEKFILYQGALNQGRGLEILIESMKKLPLKLYLAGEGDLSQALRTQVKDAGLEDKIIFTGMLSPDELQELTPKAFLGYNLLENLGKSYYYSLSNKFFDYIHACIPGLSNHFPEYEAINKSYNIAILTNLSATDIVLETERALNDKKYYKMLCENCRKARQIFNWQQEEKKLIAIYDAL